MRKSRLVWMISINAEEDAAVTWAAMQEQPEHADLRAAERWLNDNCENGLTYMLVRPVQWDDDGTEIRKASVESVRKASLS